MTIRMRRYIVLLLFVNTFCFGQDVLIWIPDTDDRYAGYVEQLEGGKTDIDYTDFRNSYLESENYDPLSYDCTVLKKKLIAAYDEKKYDDAVYIAIVMLSTDYTNLFAHKYLGLAYKSLGDKSKSKQYQAIQAGLFKSIMSSGDGKACETGWHLIQDEEMEFILATFDGTVTEEDLSLEGKNYCRKIVKTNKSGKKTYYFEINMIIDNMPELDGP